MIGDNFTSPKQLFLHSLKDFTEMTIFIGNLSWETEVQDLEQLFSNYGVVKKCYLPLDRETGRKRGFAFVDLNDQNSEKKAIDDLQDVEWMGREIRVNEAEQRKGPINKKRNKFDK
ncbi:RNA recognition motif domain-containing protein [Prochlorococcus marinus]|uniref:RNA recognition motif domain-containing protein n=1 Tax=Prochlorococcus marinus TaxID=1219 RepID=UPI001FD82277|nr:RNA-binding protein [Prochlorococcus marinus]